MANLSSIKLAGHTREYEMNKIMLKKVLILSLLFSLFACAAGPKPLNPIELIAKGTQCFSDPTVTVYTLPSYGAISDKLGIAAAKSAGNDGGFSEGFRKLVAGGNKRFVFYSTNSEKMSIFLQLALAKFKKGALAGVGICYVGEQQYAGAIAQAARRTGADFHFEAH